MASATAAEGPGPYRPPTMPPSRRVVAIFLAATCLALAGCAPRRAVAATPAPPAGYGPVAQRILELVNAERARGAVCGGDRMAPAAALTLEPHLVAAARAHSADQAGHAFMGHVGSDGSRVGDRVTRAGYRWSLVAENVAWNQPTPEVVVTAWMGSPAHCSAIMLPEVRHLGAAEEELFWTLVVAAPL